MSKLTNGKCSSKYLKSHRRINSSPVDNLDAIITLLGLGLGVPFILFYGLYIAVFGA